MTRLLSIIFICISLSMASAHPYIFRNLTTADGLGDMQIHAIHKDNSGFIWIGTGHDVECFDGTHIKKYHISEENIANKLVTSICSDSSGRLWVGTYGGLWHIDREQDSLIQVFSDEINTTVWSVINGPGNTLYIATQRGLYLYNEDRLLRILMDDNELAPDNRVYGLTFDDEGLLWITSEAGIHCMSTDGQICHFPFGQNASIRSIVHHDHRLFLGTANVGLYVFDIDKKVFKKYGDVSSNNAQSLCLDKYGNLFVGTDGNGVHIYSLDTDEKIACLNNLDRNGLSSNAVYSVLVDDRDQLWIGYYQNGLDYSLHQDHLIEIYETDGLSTLGLQIRSMAINGSERVFGCQNGVYFTDEKRGLLKYFSGEELKSRTIPEIIFHNGKYYIGTLNNGLFELNPEKLSINKIALSSRNPIAEQAVFSLANDKEGFLWIGTNKGAYRYDSQSTISFDYSNSCLSDGSIFEIFFDSTGRGWFCGGKEFVLWDPVKQSFHKDDFPDGFNNQMKIRLVYEDSNQNIYLIPERGPIFRTNLSLSCFDQMQQYAQNADTKFIAEDQSGDLWIGTSNGLFRREKDGSIRSYDFKHGLPNQSFTMCTPARDNNGNLWFGNFEGVVYTTAITDSLLERFHPQVQVVGNIINGSPESQTFLLSDLSFTKPQSMCFEYRLDGVDKDWKLLRGTTDLTYYNLPWGRHQLKVRRPGEPSTENTFDVYVSLSISKIFEYIGIGFLMLILLYFCLFLYQRRKVVYRFLHLLSVAGKEKENKTTELHILEHASDTDKYKSLYLTKDEKERMLTTITNLMIVDKMYRKTDLKIADVANSMQTTSFNISYILNQCLRSSFADFVNKYRIEDFKQKARMTDWGKHNIMDIASSCGFNSRTSFFRIFRKTMGMTPNEFIQRQECQNKIK